MTALSAGLVRRIAEAANLAPSVHNTQATRWRMEGPDAIGLYLDPARLLSVGDPEGRDAGLSAGAALEATGIVLGTHGLALRAFEPCPVDRDGPSLALGVLRLGPGEGRRDLLDLHDRRATWRGGFAPAPAATGQALERLAAAMDGVTLVPEVAALADLGDAASLGLLRSPPFREELRSWMRLTPRHPGWSRDGLNAEALALGAVEARGAGVVLRPWPFAALDAIGAAGPLLAERAKTLTAMAILLVHRPVGEPPIDSGRALYGHWLGLTGLGLAAWPLASLADEPTAQAEVVRRYAIPEDRRLVAAFRVGPPRGAAPKARLPAAELVLDPA